MRLEVMLCLLLGIGLIMAAKCHFEFDHNATQIDDPRGFLNDRFVSHNISCADKLVYYGSIRSDPGPLALETEIDTIGGLVEFKSLPMAFMAYWNGNDSWNYQDSDVTTSSTVMTMAYTTLIERNEMGEIVKSYSLAKAPSNVSAGIRWDVSVDLDESQRLRWLRMNATAHEGSPSYEFDLEVVWFLASTKGQISLGKTDVTPRVMESALAIRGYQLQNPQNYLSIRVLAAHSSTDFISTNGYVSSGSNTNALSVRLLPWAQILPYRNSQFGSNVSVSISDWQPSPGFRNAIANSAVGILLNSKFSLNWDVRVADITFPQNAQSILYCPSLGYRNDSNLFSEPSSSPQSPEISPFSNGASQNSKISFFYFFCTIALVLIAVIF